MGRKTKPRKIGAVLDALISDLGIEEKVTQYQIVELWEDVVGERIAKVTKAHKMQDRVLFVQVGDSVWRNELSMMKLQIIKMLNERVKRDLVDDIVFR
jgi:predicted nucleic acid-binding Zn ribbon protein